MNGRLARMDLGMLAAILAMLGFGVVLVYSSSFALAQHRFGGADFFLMRQAFRALMAVASFMVFINLDYHIWGRLSNAAFLLAIILLVVVLFLPESQVINGAKRWISIGSIRLQVSDFARMALILVLARGCEKDGAELRTWRVLARSLIKVGIICGLILLEPDFSTSVIICSIAVAMLFLSGANILHLAGLALSALPLVALAVLRTPYRRSRLIGFLQMSNHKSDLGYQAFQSLIGLGNGGIFGVGLGKGEQKYFYLPEPHTDFVISILGEEIGFAGLLLMMGIFVFIVYRGLRIALHAPDRMGQLMAFGFTFGLALYVLIHSCVATGLVPTTGVPLPFLSYGGMSLVFTMSSMGILLNISSQTKHGLVAENAAVRKGVVAL